MKQPFYLRLDGIERHENITIFGCFYSSKEHTKQKKKDFQISSNNGARLIIFLGPTDSEATCLVEPYNPYSCVLSKLGKGCQRNTVDSGC